MTLGSNTWQAAMAAFFILLGAGCGRDTESLKSAPPDDNPVVFDDDFQPGMDFQAFLGSKVDAVDMDTNVKFAGTASLKVTVPPPGDPSGTYAGGAFTVYPTRDLSGYTALTFYAKASKSSTLDVAGLGNNNTGESLYEALWRSIPLDTSWAKMIIPIPYPARLTEEDGLFFFAEGAEGGVGHTIWFDEVMFEDVETITNPRPSMLTQTIGTFVGASVDIQGTKVIFDVDGSDQTIEHLPAYFDYFSSNTDVATADAGMIDVVGGGTSIITAKLDTVDVSGQVTLEVTAPPTNPAPSPTIPESNVISLFSNVYTDVTVDTWSADWDLADVTDLVISGDDVKAYTNLVYAGIEFATETIDITADSMTHFHLNVWVQEGTVFKVKLVDFGEDGTYGGAPDSEHELSFTESTDPALAFGTWVSLDIPLSRFTRLIGREHIAQLIIAGDVGTAYIDNIYFHK
jgi:hypothetical protein